MASRSLRGFGTFAVFARLAVFARFAGFALFALAAPSLALARTDSEIREVVQTMVMDRHPNDTADHWRNLGPRAPAVIEGMYEASNSTYQRMRLLEGLGTFSDDPAATAFVKKQAESAKDEVVRHAAIRAIGAYQAKSEEEWLGRFIKHENPHTRLLAAEQLRRAGTTSAQSKVDGMMRDEKTAWVLSSLKGEPPAPLVITPSASSEDRLSSEFTGTWRGYWIGPSKGANGLVSEAAIFKLSVDTVSNRVGGDLTLTSRSGGKHLARTFALKDAAGRAQHWTGKLTSAPAGSVASAPIEVEAELARRASNLMLEIRSAQTGVLLVLRRD